MAKCDEGYICEVCGQAVDQIADSDLYLRYVLGQVSLNELHALPERHIRCNPVQSQFIVDAGFPPIEAEGVFDKRLLDEREVHETERKVTAAWRRLQQLAGSQIPLDQYPLDFE